MLLRVELAPFLLPLPRLLVVLVVLVVLVLVLWRPDWANAVILVTFPFCNVPRERDGCGHLLPLINNPRLDDTILVSLPAFGSSCYSHLC